MLETRNTGKILWGGHNPIFHGIAAGRCQMTAQPPEAILQELKKKWAKPFQKSPCRKTCAAEHALLLQYSTPLTNATALLHPTHHLHYSNRKKKYFCL